MAELNYHHLMYFRAVAHEGGIQKAARRLHVGQGTISEQIKALERELGTPLFKRQGRGLQLTDTGRDALRYADQIHALGQDCLDVVRGEGGGTGGRLQVGVADAVPKLIASRLLQPVIDAGVRLSCREDDGRLLEERLLRHELDLVIGDEPVHGSDSERLTAHVLGASGIGFFAPKESVAAYAGNWPDSLDGAPLLLPAPDAALRQDLESWFAALGVCPRVVGEFEDSALMKAVAGNGNGLFVAPTAIADDIARQWAAWQVGSTNEVQQRFYAIEAKRRFPHPLIAEICAFARRRIFR